jgi:hypothetical protein
MSVSRIIYFALLISGLLLISCQKETEMVNAQKFGGEVTLEESVSLAQIYTNPEQYKDKEIRIEGTIKEVCQHKGCWLKLTDGNKELTVRFKDYGFFVPKDASTSKVILQGIFTMKPDMHVENESKAQAEGKEHAEGEEQDGEKEHAENSEVKEEVEEAAPFSFTASAVIIYEEPSNES